MSLKGLSDEEIIESLYESLEDDSRVTTDYIKIECSDRLPTISGRIKSDEELQILEDILNDLIDLPEFENNVWVDDTLAFADHQEQEDDDGVEFDKNTDEMDSGDDFGNDEEV
ncbi:MAG: hypothetical protein A3G32_08205 [Deltaproteobacteria bacterium RIFCSPLOWO2_12_FULL_40_28]|nr:MAG: hypothetical protein A3C45_00905 [Deltaproteobacteria bacterium RIFCSPHIGHO2_02_FULL_40_28]OGQ20892.1 MAG: hypothetical protein A3E27_03570 [Deltaproteobacteria bacterium RIFCSPHIGHO2_12_FULL_40_32]OGQ39293.1 MAG: hypothetical protein A3I69_04930 [Deltaproteobacteria bacterium RIFCSPLOWO2_02_FULL_40_36]OGQ54574.1 MAG: hypothetical protein A3G32_08205 [Deltaproteobacteria bacterium RIFCSPLOWO2_12_FULL_40_28]